VKETVVEKGCIKVNNEQYLLRKHKAYS